MQKYLLFLSLWHRTTARYEIIIIIIIIIIIKINLRKKGLWSKSMFYFYTGKPLNKLQHLVSSSSSLGLGSRWEAVLWAQIAVIVRSQQQQPTFMIWNCRKTNKPKPLLSIVYMYSSQWDALKTGKRWVNCTRHVRMRCSRLSTRHRRFPYLPLCSSNACSSTIPCVWMLYVKAQNGATGDLEITTLKRKHDTKYFSQGAGDILFFSFPILVLQVWSASHWCIWYIRKRTDHSTGEIPLLFSRSAWVL